MKLVHSFPKTSLVRYADRFNGAKKKEKNEKNEKQSRFKSYKSCHISVNACSSTHYFVGTRVSTKHIHADRQTSVEKSRGNSFQKNKRGMKMREKKKQREEGF